MKNINKKVKVAIVGAGVAGSSSALYLGQLGLNITIFEKEKSLISGPPFCHLHAGGNLYREISNNQCIKLLKQSIDFLRFYPYIIDYRPTVIALPTSDTSTPDALLPRLKLLRDEYEALIEKDSANEVLGKSTEYFKLYSKEQIELKKEKVVVKNPKTLDEWMIPVSKSLDLNKIQFPLIIVQEYGLNLFRLASGMRLSLNHLVNVNLLTNTVVNDIRKSSDAQEWVVSYIQNNTSCEDRFDYIINAAGFRSGKIDDMIGTPCKSMVEFKAAYISKWNNKNDTLWPEIIFHGERGTPRGMGQFTPYPNGYFQLHGMTKDITLYEDGLVSNTTLSCQPKLNSNFISKIENSWSEDEISKRTQNAIKHISQFMPEFSSAFVGSKPLFGAQQIPGNDPTLRVAEVSFPTKRYARCEIVKVSSSLDMIDAIVKDLIELNYLDASVYGQRDFLNKIELKESDIEAEAITVTKEREYPEAMSNICNKSLNHTL